MKCFSFSPPLVRGTMRLWFCWTTGYCDVTAYLWYEVCKCDVIPPPPSQRIVDGPLGRREESDYSSPSLRQFLTTIWMECNLLVRCYKTQSHRWCPLCLHFSKNKQKAQQLFCLSLSLSLCVQQNQQLGTLGWHFTWRFCFVNYQWNMKVIFCVVHAPTNSRPTVCK